MRALAPSYDMFQPGEQVLSTKGSFMRYVINLKKQSGLRCSDSVSADTSLVSDEIINTSPS